MNHDTEKPSSSRPLILTVDDNPTITQLVTVFLQKHHYRVIAASDGEKGLEAAKKFLPDLILLDVCMPKMDGWTVIRHLRVLPEFSFTPIIFLTDLSDGTDRRRGFQLGADDFVHKDLICDELDFRIDKAIASARLYKQNARQQMRSMDFGSSTFTGQLDEIGLPSLILLCKEERSTGLLMLSNDDGETGLVYIVNGEVASVKRIGTTIMKNGEALSSLLTWSRGSFSLERMNSVPTEREIQEPTDQFLKEAASHVNEYIIL